MDRRRSLSPPVGNLNHLHASRWNIEEGDWVRQNVVIRENPLQGGRHK